MKKERTRNLLPAKIGFYGIIIFVGHFVFWHLAFALRVCLWNYSTLDQCITYFKYFFNINR